MERSGGWRPFAVYLAEKTMKSRPSQKPVLDLLVRTAGFFLSCTLATFPMRTS